MDSVSSILNYDKPKQDYYSILGCSSSSTMEQILTEYKIKALQLHPDKNLNKPECVEQFRQLQRAKDVLSDADKRKSYDKWLNSGIAIDFERWLAISAHHSIHWAPKTVSTRLMVEQNNETMRTHGAHGSGEKNNYLHPRSTSTSTRSIDRDQTNDDSENQLGPYCRNAWKSEDGSSTLLKKFRNYEI